MEAFSKEENENECEVEVLQVGQAGHILIHNHIQSIRKCIYNLQRTNERIM